jgi:hypothetical protein
MTAVYTRNTERPLVGSLPHRWPRIAGVLIMALGAEAAPAQAPSPFATSDRNPLVAVHGLPDSGNLFPSAGGGFNLSVDFDAANTLHDEQHDDERLFVDAESRRLTLRLGYALDDWLIEVSVPYIEHDGGSLDAFIDEFHAAFGFPDGGRGGQPTDRLSFEYTNEGETVLQFDDARAGLGDISVALGRPVGGAANHGSVAWVQLKTTTGSASELTGSGAPDLAVWLAGWRRFAPRWAGYAAGGALIMGEGEVLAEQQRDWTLFGRAGGEYLPIPWLALQAELAVHGPLYDSDTDLLGESAQITMGGWLRAFGNSRVHIAVSEDIHVGSASDVVFHLGWRTVH